MLQGQARIQESARFALEFMRRDIENAGNLGCNSNMVPGISSNFVLNQKDSANIPYEFDVLGGFAFGYDAQGTGWLPAITDLPKTEGGTSTNTFIAGTGIDHSAIVKGTDILVVRGIESRDIPHFLATPMVSSDDPDINVTRPANGVSGLGFGVDELILLHDCEKATLFQVTSISDTNPIVIQHDDSPTDDWSNLNDRLSTINVFSSDAAVSAMLTTVFFIAPGESENTSGNTPLSLWRKRGVEAPVELVEGVEDLQVTYGVGDEGYPERYVTANQIGTNTVYTVRVSIVANTVDDVGGAVATTHGCDVQSCYPGETGSGGIDGLQRRPFSRTISLKN